MPEVAPVNVEKTGLVTVINRRNHPVTIRYKDQDHVLSPHQRAMDMLASAVVIPSRHSTNVVVIDQVVSGSVQEEA